MRIGFFGGSFDPVHTEHVRLAQSAVQDLGLDKLIVIPAAQPPHKKGKILADGAHRLEMCRLAFEELPCVEISDYELSKDGLSYTYLTCEHFRALYPTAELFWLVGTDMLRDFPTWKYPEKILRNVTLAVCARAEDKAWEDKEQENFYRAFGRKFTVLRYCGEDVSSTKIRVLAGAGMDLSDFVPQKVADYITKNRLYFIDGAPQGLALEKESRKQHSLRVAVLAAKRAVLLGLSERKAIAAALFHDCAKNLTVDSPYLKDFSLSEEWGNVPPSVLHQYQGAYVAERFFAVNDKEIIDAIRYHTSGRPNMGELEKLIFLADMLEEERSYDCVEELRALFWRKEGLDDCLTEALRQTLIFIERKGATLYPLTKAAYEFYKNERKKGE